MGINGSWEATKEGSQGRGKEGRREGIILGYGKHCIYQQWQCAMYCRIWLMKSVQDKRKVNIYFCDLGW